MKSADQYNAALRGRLNKLADRFQQVEIARRTGVATANVHRYLRAGRIPAEFCLALIDAFDLSPDWLMKGEGEPITSDLKAATAAKAGDLLDLVKAMNAVARMRLGAVVGDGDRKKLRELSDTLQTFDRLKERMNDRTRPVLARLLDASGTHTPALIAAAFAFFWAGSPYFAWLVSQSAETEDRLEVRAQDQLPARAALVAERREVIAVGPRLADQELQVVAMIRDQILERGDAAGVSDESHRGKGYRRPTHPATR